MQLNLFLQLFAPIKTYLDVHFCALHKKFMKRNFTQNYRQICLQTSWSGTTFMTSLSIRLALRTGRSSTVITLVYVKQLKQKVGLFNVMCDCVISELFLFVIKGIKFHFEPQ